MPFVLSMNRAPNESELMVAIDFVELVDVIAMEGVHFQNLLARPHG